MFKMKKTSFMVRCALQTPAMVLFLVVANPLRAELPVAASAGAWNARNPHVRLTNPAANHMLISQDAGSPINNWVLNWESFNISAGNRVQFLQPGGVNSNHIALNRIAAGSASVIRGQIDANGRIYLINPNGFLFGSSSVINVNSLVASSLALNISDEDFIANNVNLLNVINNTNVIDANGNVILDANGNPIVGDGKAFVNYGGGVQRITIEPGASIAMAGGVKADGTLDTTLDDGGTVYIIAPEIINRGNISTRSGQVILAAAQDSVYLTPSQDSALRGFLVELGGTGGKVENAGNILAERGNITLAGLSINQDGLLQATTSIFENGSIRLLARDSAQLAEVDDRMNERVLGVASAPNVQYQVARNTVSSAPGVADGVTMTGNSRIVITADSSDTTLVVDEQEVNLSRVEITGHDITMESNALIAAAGGEVLLHATDDPSLTAVNKDGVLNARGDFTGLIELQAGSRIDVSGTTDNQVAMERNQLEIQLTGDFLADAPLQRDGALRNERVNVDIREGTPLGDIADEVAANVKRDIGERLAAGGSVQLLSQGGVLMAQGSEVNIAGGAVTYDAGYVSTSQLVTTQGQVVAMADADPDLAYRGQFGSLTITPERWGSAGARSWSLFGGGSGVSRYFAGYTEGQHAGSFTIQAHAVAGMADIEAGTVVSPLDRTPVGQGGSLVIKTNAQDVHVLADAASPLLAEMMDWLENGGERANFALQLDDAVFASGLSSVNLSGAGASSEGIDAGGDVVVAATAQIQMAAGANLTVDAGTAEVQGNINMAGGVLDISVVGNARISGVVDVSGNWVNDNPFAGADLTLPVALNGGSITIAAANVQMADESALLANGGGWLQADGNLQSGEGGSISLKAAFDDTTSELDLPGRMEAFGINDARGGSLSITANRIRLAADAIADEAGLLQFTPEFFTQNGFADYTLTANQGELVVVSNTHITPRASNWVLDADAAFRQSGEAVRDFSHEQQLAGYTDDPDEQPVAGYARAATNLSLISSQSALSDQTPAADTTLTIGQGASIETDAGATVRLESASRLLMNGTITAHGGDINLTLNGYKDQEVDAGQMIRVDGTLDVSGIFVAEASDSTGLRGGQMFDGGNIDLTAKDGFVITSASSLLDVSAVADTMNLPDKVIGNSVISWSDQPVFGDAGSINITAAEGMVLDGVMAASAAAESASGGSLSLALNTRERANTNSPAYTSSQQSRQINLVQSVADLPDVAAAGDAVDVSGPDSLIAQAWVAADSITGAGFDHLQLTANAVSTSDANGIINIHDDVNLSLRQSLVLNSPIIKSNGQASLDAAYVLLGSTNLNTALNGNVLATGGSGNLTIHADGLLDIAGDVRFQGIDELALQSDGDLRVRGLDRDTTEFALAGSLQAGNNLSLSADQIYATTFSDFAFTAADTLNITGSGEQAPVLSAGSTLSFNADVIHHAGVVKAPVGEVHFNANELDIQSGSLTSVSAEGQMIPFGLIKGERSWLYGADRSGSTSIDNVLTAPPDKRITLNADSITMANDAEFDISGGGDLYAWEHVPGLGGSNDNLLPAYNNGAFAVLPGYSGYAAYDGIWWDGVSGINMGDQVYLGGSRDLAAGMYTVLPARYALLPGAVLVTPTGTDLLPGQQYAQLDGARVVAGQMGVANTAVRDQQWSGFVIESGDVVRSRSEYFETTASQFYRDAAARNNTALAASPEDAGALDIIAGSRLTLAGVLHGGAATVSYVDEDGATQTARGRSSQVNIAGDNLRVVNAVDAQGGIQLLDDALNEFGTASLLLGGTRHRTADGTQIDVSADTVTIVAGAELQVPDVILAATDTITIESGASVHGLGDAGVLDEVLLVDGDGALVRVSNAAQVSIQRDHESANPVQGEINVATGAVLEAGESMVLDASFNSVVNGQLVMTDGSLNFGSSRISLGEVSGMPNGLVLDSGDLGQLTVAELVLTSRSSVDLYGNLDLTFANLAIEAAAIDGYQQTGENAVLRAGNLRIGNPADNANNGTPTGLGNLTLAADNIELDDGRLALRGFNDVTLQSAGDIAIAGKGELDVVTNGTVALDGRITASQRRADYTVNANNGLLVTTRTATTDLPPRSEALAASLTLQAEQIVHQGVIDLASGDVTLQATGSNNHDDVLLVDGSVINVSGIARDFAGDMRYSAGGNIELIADAGYVNQQAGAVVNVSGGGDQGAAGSLTATATQGGVELAGSLLATHGEAAEGGRFVADAQTINNLSELNQQLNANGFDEQRHIRLRLGDITLGADETITAHDVALATDTGSISINGLINASGEKGGTVNLAARDNVTLAAGAEIDARATGTDQRGGQLFIETRDGMIDLAASSTIQLAGTGTGRDGRLHLRAPRTAGNNGINIASVATDISGFERIDLEGYKTYSVGTDNILNNSDFVTPFSEAEAFMGNDILSMLGFFSVALDEVHLRPGVEFNATGDLPISGDLDFIEKRYSNNGHVEAGVLTVRSTGNMTVNGSISDGFVMESDLYGNNLAVLQAGNSWSYRFVAGADFNAVQVMATQGVTADMFVAADKVIRTGNGDIDIAVADNLVLGDNNLDATQNGYASIYSAGVNTGRGTLAADVGDFVADWQGQGYGTLLDFIYLPGLQFPEQGGDVNVAVGGDIDGNVTSYLATDWLQRVAIDVSSAPENNEHLVTWGVDFRQVLQGMGAFGGGDVSVTAGGDVNKLALYTPVTGRQIGQIQAQFSDLTGAFDLTGSTNEVELLGGGDIALHVGGDISKLFVHVDKGSVVVAAGGDVGSASVDSGVYLLLADTQASVTANGDIYLQGISNSTLQPMSLSQQINMQSIVNPAAADLWNFFYTMTESAALSIASLGGDVVQRNDLGGALYANKIIQAQGNNNLNLVNNYPGTVSLLAMDGSIGLASFDMIPAPLGQLSILAQDNIQRASNQMASTTSIKMQNFASADLPGWQQPLLNAGLLIPGVAEREEQYSGLLHEADALPVRIVARDGDIAPLDERYPLFFKLPKAVGMYAGRDLVAVNLAVDHMRETDISILQAGRDFRYINTVEYGAGAVQNELQLHGPGELQIIAGRDINLGNSAGIQSLGNTDKKELADSGADILVMAGANSADFQAFINNYFVAGSEYEQALIDFMQAHGFAGENFADARIAFLALDEKQQRSLVVSSYFNELSLSAQRAAAEQNNLLEKDDLDRFGYSRGLDAMATLFPTSIVESRAALAGEKTNGNVIVTGGLAYEVNDQTLEGDVTMIASNITAQDNGSSLSVLAPGGMLNVGLTVKNASESESKPNGLLTFGDGDINIYSLGDIAVNQSRIQALNGGDMTIWSTLGDIDAGKGAKSQLSLPNAKSFADMETVRIYLEYTAAAQGSGIRGACFDAGCEPGNIVLAAPGGVIDAGDAGINSAGNLVLATDTVLNAGNIEAGGESVGFSTETSALGLDLGNLSSAATDATSTVSGEEAADAFSNAAVAILQVEVMGLEDDDNTSTP